MLRIGPSDFSHSVYKYKDMQELPLSWADICTMFSFYQKAKKTFHVHFSSEDLSCLEIYITYLPEKKLLLPIISY